MGRIELEVHMVNAVKLLLRICVVMVLLTGCAWRGAVQMESSGLAADGKGPVGETETAGTNSIGTEAADVNLPQYAYTGEDPYMQGICDYMVSLNGKKTEGELYLPTPVILKTEQVGEERLVYGMFWSFWYQPEGENLMCTRGGEDTGLIRMKQAGDTLQVTAFERVGDGSDYVLDLQRICKGHKGLYQQFLKKEIREDKREQVRKDLMAGYVKEHGLDFVSYQDFGWDPVMLGDEGAEPAS